MIEGFLYKKNSSDNQKAKLLVSADIFTLTIENQILKKEKISSLTISSRLANTQREILFEDGLVFLTNDNDKVDKLIVKKRSFLHFLESNLFIILLSIIMTALLIFSFTKSGIPYLSKKLSSHIPLKISKAISNNSLEVLDKYIFKKSNLSDSRRDEIQILFKNKILPLINEKRNLEYKLSFRSWDIDKKAIPNALAFPNGEIILTDEIVKISENPNELISIILHEIAHVKKQHGMQRILESSFITIAIILIVGDVSMLGDLGIGLSSLLINNNYSRDHEQEADIFAFDKMLENNINPKYFITIMDRINKSIGLKNENKILNYLSSHPNTNTRLLIAKKYEECFNKQLLNCDSIISLHPIE